jgi:hypothetical protein
MATGANAMLYRHNRRVAFAVEKAFELAKQIAIDFGS